VADIVNTEQYEAWNGEGGERWVAEAERRDEVLAPAGEAVLAAARLTAGQAVVDIGCGCGATTMAASHAVGAEGTVYGIDLSGPMLEVARQRVEAAGLGNVTLVQGDVQAHEFPAGADVVISRFGTMFFADPVAALANLRKGVKPGGRISFGTWQPLEANAWLTIPGEALRPFGIALDQASPMFGQADEAAVTTTLEAAGYSDPLLRPVAVDLPVGADVDAALDYLLGTGLVRFVVAEMPEDQRSAASAAIREALVDHAGPDGRVDLGAGIWIVTASG
jgi:SAM-dependent methyltransferase